MDNQSFIDYLRGAQAQRKVDGIAADPCCPPADRAAVEKVADRIASQCRNVGVHTDLLDAIFRSTPINVPVWSPFGDVTLGMPSPDESFGIPYDVLKAMVLDPVPTEYLKDADAESSGSITSVIAAGAGRSHRVRALYFNYDTDPDQNGANEAQEAITWSSEDANADGVQYGQSGTTPFAATDVAATNTDDVVLFTLPATKTGGFYWHPARRTASWPKVVPSRAMVTTNAALTGNFVAARTISCATTLLVSGSNLRKFVSAIYPGTPQFERYAALMLARHYVTR